MKPFEPAVVVLPEAHPATTDQIENLMLEQRLYRIDGRPEPIEHAARPLVRRPWMLRNLMWARAGRCGCTDHAPLVTALVTDHLSSLSANRTEQIAVIGMFLQDDMQVFVDCEEWTAAGYQRRLEAMDSASVLRLVDALEQNLAAYLQACGPDLPDYPAGIMFESLEKSWGDAVWRAHELAALPGSTPTSVMRRLQLEGYKNRTHGKVVWNLQTARQAMEAPLPDRGGSAEAGPSAPELAGDPR